MGKEDAWQGIDVCWCAVREEDKVELGGKIRRRTGVCRAGVQENADCVEREEEAVVGQRRQRRELQHRVSPPPDRGRPTFQLFDSFEYATVDRSGDPVHNFNFPND